MLLLILQIKNLQVKEGLYMKEGLAHIIYNCFKQEESFTLKDAYSHNTDKPKEAVRARIYEKLRILKML